MLSHAHHSYQADVDSQVQSSTRLFQFGLLRSLRAPWAGLTNKQNYQSSAAQQLTQILVKFIPKQGLVDATADKFAEQQGIKIKDEDIKHESDTKKTQQN